MSSRAKQSPEDSQAVLAVDVEAVLEDEATEKLANAYFEVSAQSEYYSGPESYEEALNDAEDESDLPPTDLQWSVAFGNYDTIQGSGDAYGGVAFSANWTEEEVVAALEDDRTEFAEDEYGEKTVYENQRDYSDATLGVLDDVYVLGTADAVEDAIDVENGDEESVGEELADAFESARDGSAVRFATEVPADTVPKKVPIGRGDSMELDAYQDVPYVTGAVYSTDESVGVELRMLAEDSDAADAVKEQTEALITVSRSLDSTSEEMEEFLEGIEVEIDDGSTVVLSYEEEVDALVDRIEATTS